MQLALAICMKQKIVDLYDETKKETASDYYWPERKELEKDVDSVLALITTVLPALGPSLVSYSESLEIETQSREQLLEESTAWIMCLVLWVVLNRQKELTALSLYSPDEKKRAQLNLSKELKNEAPFLLHELTDMFLLEDSPDTVGEFWLLLLEKTLKPSGSLPTSLSELS